MRKDKRHGVNLKTDSSVSNRRGLAMIDESGKRGIGN